MNKFIFFTGFMTLAIFATACTYNISMAHTQGTATDVIDDNATPTATATIPVNVVPNAPIPIPATVIPRTL